MAGNLSPRTTEKLDGLFCAILSEEENLEVSVEMQDIRIVQTCDGSKGQTTWQLTFGYSLIAVGTILAVLTGSFASSYRRPKPPNLRSREWNEAPARSAMEMMSN